MPFDWICVYITFAIVLCKIYITRVARAFRPSYSANVSRLSKSKFLLQFRIGNTHGNLIVKRNGPLDFYRASDENDSDITEEIVPYMTFANVEPTPALLGYKSVTLWDIDDSPREMIDSGDYTVIQ